MLPNKLNIMKLKFYIIASAFLYSGLGFAQEKKSNIKQLQKIYSKHLKESQKSKKQRNIGEVPPNPYNEQDFLNTLNPATGSPEFEKVIQIKGDLKAGLFKSTQPLKILGGSNDPNAKFNQDPWIERGPYSVGGRTRAIMFDPNDPTGKRVFAGSVSGGLWVNQDPSVATNQWTPINDFWANISISSITFDPNNPQVFYVGTGETETTDIAGAGIWKSTNGGTTWTQIFTIPVTYSSTGVRNGNFYINDVKVRNNNGVSEVYAGVSGTYVGIGFNDGWSGMSQAGLYKSTDGGATFTKNTNLLALNSTTGVTSTTGYSIQQIEIDAANNVWVSTRTSRFSNIDSGGRIFSSSDGNTFTLKYNANLVNSRVKFGVSKTNPLKVYALLQGAGTAEPIRIIKTIDGGTTWASTNDTTPTLTLPDDADTGIAPNDFTRGQSFYDLVIVPDPLNDEIVYTGGIDLFKSTNGAASWTQISKWSNNNNLAAMQISTVHADQHAIVFNPFNNYSTNQMMFGNDGGVYFAANKNSLAATSTIAARNTRYNVTQYYGATLNPTATPASEELLAGAQDNGTQWLYGAPQANGFLTTQNATGGDGMYTEYDDQDNYEIASYVYNTHYLLKSSGTSQIIQSATDRNLGQFVNPLALDRNNDIIYTNRSGLTVFRTPSLSGTAALTNTVVTLGTALTNELISKLRVSPYTTGSTTLFVGTNLGRILKITNANTGTTPTSIAMTLPSAGNVSDIKFGASENQILVTLSNYNVTSVYYTTNGGTTWQNKEGNLPDMPIRAIFMNPDENEEVLVGTEAGVWATQNFSATTPTWAQYSNGIGNVKITSLDYRPSTKTLLVATYGRGAWTNQNATTQLSTSENAVSKFHTTLYPNPTRGNVALRFDKSKYSTLDINVFDTSGRLVFTKNNVKSDEEFSTGLKNGNYVLKASSNAQQVYSSFLQIGKKQSAD